MIFSHKKATLSWRAICQYTWSSANWKKIPYAIHVESDTYVDVNRWSYIFSQEIIIQTEATRRGWFGCAQQQTRGLVLRKGKAAADSLMYEYNYYPTYCAGSCYGMTREVIDRLLAQVSQTRFYYLDNIYLTGILRRKASLKPPTPIHNGPLMCQHLADLRFLAKRFQIEYKSTTVDELIREAHQKKFELVAQ